MAGTVVGLDIGSSTIKVAEVARASRDFRIARAAVVPTPYGAVLEGAVANTEALKDAISAAFQQAGIRNRRVNTALGGKAVVVREIQLPGMPDEELAQAVRFEAERYLPVSGENLAVDYHVFERAKQGQRERTEVLFVAARRDVVDGFVNVMRQAGVTPEVMEVTSFALMRAFQKETSDGALLIADLGAESTDVIVVHDGRLRLSRSVPVGGNMLTRAVAAALDLEPTAAQVVKEEKAVAPLGRGVPEDPTAARVVEAVAPVIGDMVTEIRRSVEFFQSRGSDRVRKAILVGGTARMPNLPALFADELGLPVEVGDVLVAMPADHAPAGSGPVIAAAVGLALRGAEP
ncbi:MAG: type IV pilus assembly protein PilM [Armatimonadota bacterium]|nr:type IV pilus assembly protein PilM [Armatimonadota bacterium]MDR5697253.1 type IV pilus assembly protein PilM [Armatimonadota bacterium]